MKSLLVDFNWILSVSLSDQIDAASLSFIANIQ